ncbi:MAG: helix-turn-helix transcriptional regulator, partial [Hymenobacter sp.]
RKRRPPGCSKPSGSCARAGLPLRRRWPGRCCGCLRGRAAWGGGGSHRPGRAGRPRSREREILGLLVEGYSYKMIAAHCFSISLDTVRSHIKNIYEKLHVRSAPEAVSKALREGLS